MSDTNNVPKECINSTRNSIYTRRCFITGELCSKQTNVHKEREILHKKDEINAFVIMNFSGMSDIVYKWKLCSFIESLKQYLYLDPEGQRIACISSHGDLPTDDHKTKWTRVKKINVIRADTNTASNYIICSRICQQIQIADLIIVDVSVENTNVFYEFGLAAAFGKLILPICYNESFYEMKIPKKAAELLENMRQQYARETDDALKNKRSNDIEELRKLIEHHIDCYPWRRKLFENYGIRYRNSKSQVHYGLFPDVTQDVYGFSDRRYGRFPYDAIINDADKPLISIKGDYNNEDDYKKVGFLIYDRLRSSYHTKQNDQESDVKEPEKYKNSWNDEPPKNQQQPADAAILDPHNTLVVYTMDGILNEEQAGQCIINFYNNMTLQIQKEHCFCGDRVAILSQSNVILDDPKDTKVDKKLLYGVGDIIRIGMNQATYVAHQQRIKTDDYLLDDSEEYVGTEPRPAPENANEDSDELQKWENDRITWENNLAYWIAPLKKDSSNEQTKSAEKTDTANSDIQNNCIEKYKKAWKEKYDWSEDTIRFIKDHVRNRCIPLLPDDPIYVKQYMKGIQQKLFHANVLVDRTKNNKEFDHANFFTMFHMILYTLRYANQVVVDISGNSLQALFWLGVAHGCDVPAITVRHAPTTDEISRMDNPEVSKDRRIFDVAGLWTATLNANDVDSFYNQLSLTQTGIEQHNRLTLQDIDTYQEVFSDLFYDTWRHNPHKQKDVFVDFILRKQEEESKKLESFYRNSFWRRLLRTNELDLYIARYNEKGDQNKQPRILDIAWDVQATAELNKYLSKRTVIGQYTLREIQKEKEDTGDGNANSNDSSDAKVQNENTKNIRNFISIGGGSHPLPPGDRNTSQSLTRYIQQKSGCSNQIRKIYISASENVNLPIRGFQTYDEKEGFYTQFPLSQCIDNKCPDNCPYIASKIEPTLDPRNDTANQIHNFQNTVITKCELTKEKKFYQQLAQMVLWRDVDNEDRSNIKFWVSLVGVSGPSTLALTSLLVDDKQKELLFTSRNKDKELDKAQSKDVCAWCKTPLKDLQHRIRNEVLRVYDQRLKEKMGIKDDSPQNTSPLPLQYEQLSYATKLYLSTILYQYFFPFLTLSDEMRIMNSMHNFLTAMSSAEVRTFQTIKSKTDFITNVEDALRETIESLKGVDILYTVTVQSENSEEDNRWPVDIRQLDNAFSEDSVVCLFTNKEPPQQSSSS